MAGAYKIMIQPCDVNATSSNGVRKTGAGAFYPADHAVPTCTVVKASDVQLDGIKAYLAVINAGTDTSSVETALGAIL